MSSAAEPAYPILFEILQAADEDLMIELLDMMLGFAICAPVTDTGWARQLWQNLQADRLHYITLTKHPNADISDFAEGIVEALQA